MAGYCKCWLWEAAQGGWTEYPDAASAVFHVLRSRGGPSRWVLQTDRDGTWLVEARSNGTAALVKAEGPVLVAALEVMRSNGRPVQVAR